MKSSDDGSPKTDLALPAIEFEHTDNKIVKTKSTKKRGTKKTKTAKKTSRAKVKITDELLLDTVRDDVYLKLKTGDFNLSLADGFKAIDLKHKIIPAEPDNRLAMLLEELRKELMR
ncbi:MAG: hypothetical protein GY855_11300 [candidate division Zixibacteria bacterium]|nr:hypothetical protein [candidate division Zixibacteria bacterium]